MSNKLYYRFQFNSVPDKKQRKTKNNIDTPFNGPYKMKNPHQWYQ